MAALTTVPDAVDLTGYAGDDLTVAITISDAAYTTGCTWSGEVRATRDASTADATWEITPAGAGGGATAVLTGDQTRALIELVSPVVMETRAYTATPTATTSASYQGVYDIQVSRVGFTRTLVQGNITIELDVTRTTP